MLGDTDDTSIYRDTKSIAILLSILHKWQNLLIRCFGNFVTLMVDWLVTSVTLACCKSLTFGTFCMKMDKKLKLQHPLNSPSGAQPLVPTGGSAPRPTFTLDRDPRARHDPPFGQILDPPLHVGSGSEVLEGEHIVITD